MDSNSLITTMKERYDYFHNWQQSVMTSDKETSPEEKAIIHTAFMYTEGAKDALRMLARELELNVDYITLEKK